MHACLDSYISSISIIGCLVGLEIQICSNSNNLIKLMVKYYNQFMIDLQRTESSKSIKFNNEYHNLV